MELFESLLKTKGLPVYIPSDYVPEVSDSELSTYTPADKGEDDYVPPILDFANVDVRKL